MFYYYYNLIIIIHIYVLYESVHKITNNIIIIIKYYTITIKLNNLVIINIINYQQ